MEYSIEICSQYDITTIGDKQVIVFNDHNMAIPAWGTIRQNYNAPLRLVTFDTHPDTRAAFAREICKEYHAYNNQNCQKFQKNILSLYHCHASQFNFEDAFRLAIELVANDEQIMVADYYDYINEYIVFCSLPNDELREYQLDDRMNGQNATYYSKHHIRKLPDAEITSICSTPFILDFDLDYFTSPDIIDTVFKEKISLLIKNASAITIAKEPKYFELEKTDENFDNSRALKMLLDLIREVCDAK